MLRPWAAEDAGVLFAAWTDPTIARWNPVPPEATVERAIEWIDGCEARLANGNSLDLCIQASMIGGEGPVGEVGLSGFDADRGAAMIGYWLLPDARRHGLAGRAVDAVAEWALSPEGLGLQLLVAQCGAANLASQGVARRARFVHARNDGAGHELWVRRALLPQEPSSGSFG